MAAHLANLHMQSPHEAASKDSYIAVHPFTQIITRSITLSAGMTAGASRALRLRAKAIFFHSLTLARRLDEAQVIPAALAIA